MTAVMESVDQLVVEGVVDQYAGALTDLAATRPDKPIAIEAFRGVNTTLALGMLAAREQGGDPEVFRPKLQEAADKIGSLLGDGPRFITT